MTKEVEEYFFEQYDKACFMVVPGYWPNFKSKEEVDTWILKFEMNTKMIMAYSKKI